MLYKYRIYELHCTKINLVGFSERTFNESEVCLWYKIRKLNVPFKMDHINLIKLKI